MLPDDIKPFRVVWNASNFAIVCALIQFNNEGRARVVSLQSRQIGFTERNYPEHNKEISAMPFVLVKFRIYLLG